MSKAFKPIIIEITIIPTFNRFIIKIKYILFIL